jgi:hypothetical protein
MNARTMAQRLVCAVLPALLAACATPPKPKELEAYEMLRTGNNLQEANKKSPDLVASAEKLGEKSREEWQSNDLEESRRDAIMANIKLKTALALMEQEQLKAKIQTLSADQAKAEEEAADLAENRYNLKKTMERILTSRAYQMPAVAASEQNKDYVFRGPSVRRMSAEQYLDALSSVTGVWANLPAGQVDFSAGKRGDASWTGGPNAAPKWIWNDSRAAEKAEPATVYFRKEIDLPEQPTAAVMVVACDNSFKLYVNGKEAGRSGGEDEDWRVLKVVDIAQQLQPGRNVLAIAATNAGSTPNAAGLIGRFTIDLDEGSPLVGAIDKTCHVSAARSAGRHERNHGKRTAEALGRRVGVDPATERRRVVRRFG